MQNGKRLRKEILIETKFLMDRELVKTFDKNGHIDYNNQNNILIFSQCTTNNLDAIKKDANTVIDFISHMTKHDIDIAFAANNKHYLMNPDGKCKEFKFDIEKEFA
jgi:phage/plasmid-associated DNA primase